MKCFTIVAFVCFAFVPSVVSDDVAETKEDTQGAQHPETPGHEGISSSRRKRSVFHLFNMVTCATSCNPLVYKGYGCYCGFLGSGMVVDGIDKCCKGHDWCYEHANCFGFDHYLAPYRWKCNGGNPYCVATRGPLGGVNSCGHQLCECDREFVECLKQHPCPKTKAICMTSPWRYWQNLFMGVSSGSGMHQVHEHSLSPSPPQDDKYHTSPSPSSSSPAPQEEKYTPSSSLSSSSSSPQTPPQDDEHYTTSSSHTSPTTQYQDPSDTPHTSSSSSSPSQTDQEPSSSPSSSLLLPHQDNLHSSPSSNDNSLASHSPPSPSPHDNLQSLSDSHHRMSLHSTNPFQSQHVKSAAHTPHHPNEAF